MTSGIGSAEKARSRPKPNGRAPDDAGNVKMTAKELTAPNSSMENLFVQFMSLDGPQLRAVFDRAIADHNARVATENTNYTENMADIDQSVDDAQDEIAQHQEAIQKLSTKIESLHAHKLEDQHEHNARLDKLDEARALIENTMQLFKHKLDGFAE